MMNLETLLMIFIGGASYTAAGLLKSKAGGESFDQAKFLKTIILAGLLAVVNSLMGEGDLSEVELLAQGAGQTVLLDKLLKALILKLRRLMADRWLG